MYCSPKTKWQLRHFLRVINFYQDVWRRCSHLLSPLTGLVGSTAKLGKDGAIYECTKLAPTVPTDAALDDEGCAEDVTFIAASICVDFAANSFPGHFATPERVIVHR